MFINYNEPKGFCLGSLIEQERVNMISKVVYSLFIAIVVTILAVTGHPNDPPDVIVACSDGLCRVGHRPAG